MVELITNNILHGKDFNKINRLFFVLILPLLIASCNKKEPEPVYDDLKISVEKLDLKTETHVTFNIEAGSGDYEVKTSDDNIADVSLTGKTVTVTAKKEKGEVKITVIDKKTKQRKKVTVNVTVKIPDLVVNTDIKTVNVGEKITVIVTAGSGNYKVEANEFVKTEINGSDIIVEGVKKGKGKIVITDLESKQSMELEITVTVRLGIKVGNQSIVIGEKMTIFITSGSGKYKVETNEFVKAELKETTVIVEGVKEGEGEIKIMDDETGQSEVVRINVTVKILDLAVKVEKDLIKVDEITKIIITSGSGEYKVESNSFVKTELNDTIVTVTGIAEGLGRIIITDSKTEQAKSVKIAVSPKIQASMVMTTYKSVNDEIKLKIDAEDVYRPAVWIDLNNNQIKDEGEEIKKFDEYQTYKIASQTIVIYGKVKYLSAINAGLISLDVSKNHSLEILHCFANKLKELDLNDNVELVTLGCSNNQIERLNLSNNVKLEQLFCNENKLIELDLSKCVNLKEVRLSKNSLQKLDVTNNTLLKKLILNWNRVTSLDVSKNTKLEKLYCDGNRLKTLNTSECKDLKELYCTNNEITTLDIKGNVLLKELVCYRNKLSALDISKNTALTTLSLHTNLIKNEAMTSIVNSLPERGIGDNAKFRVVNADINKRSNECKKELVDAAKRKGWQVQNSNGKEYKGE